jgi:RNA-splicing ligase RtcB
MIELVGRYTKAKIFAETIEDGVYSQVYDIINCKAFEGQTVVCMPDVHVGASGPCGLVATIGNYVCPEHIGVDIGCSVSMMILNKKVPADKYAEFERRIKNKIPFGFNLNGHTVIDEKEFFKFLTTGFNKYRNFWPEMLMDLPTQVTEKWVSEQLKRLGMEEGVFYKSLGSVGGGNHFIEYDEQEDGDLAGVTLHFGSRNFGVKVCKYWMGKTNVALTKDEVKEYTAKFKENYIKTHTDSRGKRDMNGFKEALNKYLETMSEGHIKGYLNGEMMKGYLMDMCFAQLYAQFNHMTVQKTIKELLIKYGIKEVRTIMSTHNFIDLHDHTLRKSAIRSYKGEEMLVPFNMRDGVAICEGLSNPEWLNACAHGAGRKMSRSKAKQNVSMEEFKESMKNVYSTTVCQGTIDESPMAYKDTTEIKDLITETCEIKFMMIPKINIKAADGGD